MIPVLINLSFLKIYTFGIFLVLSFFWGTFLLWKNIRLTAIKEEDIFDGLFLALGGAIFFGRLTYVLFNFEKFGFDFLKFILINGYPGLSLYGALLGGIFILYIYFLIKKIKYNEAIDYFISPLFLSIAFGKLGSFFSGSEIGAKTKFILSIKYAGVQSLRHLTPFYEAALFFLGAYLSYKLLFEIRREKYPKGFSSYFFWWFFAVIYFGFDKIKGNKLYFLGQSFNWFISLIILLTFSVYFIYYFRGSIIKMSLAIRNSVITYGKQTYQRFRKKIRKKTSDRS